MSAENGEDGQVESPAAGAQRPDRRLLATMVSNQVGLIRLDQWHVPLALIVAGGGVLSFARVMRIGVAMRDELAATV